MSIKFMPAILTEIAIGKIADSPDKMSASIEMDRLSPFFTHFTLSARVFYSGRLCGTSGNHKNPSAGHLHVLRRGRVRVTQPNRRAMVIEQPSVVLFPRPREHRLWADETSGADILCA